MLYKDTVTEVAKGQTNQAPRGEFVIRLAEAISSFRATHPQPQPQAHPLRVAVDGAPASGKTTLADELAAVLRARGRDVIRASIDDFLVHRAHRYRRGRYSAEGCYFDAHDRAALCGMLLDPLGPGGDRRFRRALFDGGNDTGGDTASPPTSTAPADAVLLFDGVFLLRPELIDRWDLRIFVSVPFERTVDRARERDAAPAGSATDATDATDTAYAANAAEIERSWRDRYIPAQRLYFSIAHPADHADIIVYNDQLHRPTWEIRPNSSISGI